MFNSKASIRVHKIGNGLFPLLVIDDFAVQPDNLIKQAAQASFQADPGDYYPGIRASLPEAYISAMVSALKSIMQGTVLDDGPALHCPFHAWSLTTQPEHLLKPIQCIPHFDDTNPHKYAMVHYLFREELGGTSFFRHNKTGFEAITNDNQQRYMKTLGMQATSEGLPDPAYIQSSTRLFNEYHHVAAKFNRAIVYPSHMLHSGMINADKGLSENPKYGRLTANMALMVSTP